MTAKISWSVNDGPEHIQVRDCGLLPIMVRVSYRISAVSCNTKRINSRLDVISEGCLPLHLQRNTKNLKNLVDILSSTETRD